MTHLPFGSRSSPTNRLHSMLFTTVASLVWGTMFVAANFGLHYTNPYSLTFLRWGVAATVALIADLLSGGRIGLAKVLRRWPVWIVGGVEATGFVLQYLGQDLTNASNATLLSNLTPIFAPFLALIMFREGIKRTQVIAALLGLTGLVFVAGPFRSSETFIGDFLLVGASAAYAMFVVLSKKTNLVSIGSAFGVIVTMAMFLLPTAILLGGLNLEQLASIGSIGWYSILYMGIAGGIIAMGLYLRGLASISAGESSILLLGEVLTGLILAVSILGESLTFVDSFGIVFLLLAISIPTVGNNTRNRKLPPCPRTFESRYGITTYQLESRVYVIVQV